MTETRRTLLVTAALAITLLLAGCATLAGDDTSPDEPDVSADELQSASLDAMAEIETATVSTEMTATADSETVVNVTADGVVDYDAERMHVTTETKGALGETEITQYVVNGTLYMNMDGEWVKGNASEQSVWQSDKLSQQADLLEEADLNVTGETTVDGHDVYVVEADIDGETLQSIVNEKAGSQEMMPGETPEISNVSVTQYIDVDDSYVRATEMSVEMTTGGQTMTMEMSVELSEINEPVEIELPEEAEDADEFDQSTF